MNDRKSVLCVGLVCLDIISGCDHYPVEDEDMRVSTQRWSKGGNAANTASVLKILDKDNTVEFMGTIGTGVETEFILKELDEYGIIHDQCRVHHGYRVPTSCVILNTTTGTRTIVHYRNLPELNHDDFMKLNLTCYSWIHFEGKNPTELSKMVDAIRFHNNDLVSQGLPPITISIELEKKKDELKSLECLPDVLFISKEYALYRGYQSAEGACQEIRGHCREDVIVVCAWGEKGATATDITGQVVSAPSFPPPGGIVDTLGAGDTFNGAVIHSLSRGDSVKDAILFGCKVAGAKCGMEGFGQLMGINWNSV